MTKRAEELAKDLWSAANPHDYEDFLREAAAALETYGREVREAAATHAETNSSAGAFPAAVAATIRKMPLP